MLGAVSARNKDIPVTTRRSQSGSGLRRTGKAREIVEKGVGEALAFVCN